MKKKYVAILRVFVFICGMTLGMGSLSAQQVITVTGTCTDETGPLPGVTVQVKGTTIGTRTDVSGRYTLVVPTTATVLQFSYLGYTTVEETVGERRQINVVLKEVAKDLEEVVVIGYQSVQKRYTSGTVASIRAEEMANLPSASFANLLAGKTTGVMSMNLGGGPGQAGAVVIRGSSVVSGSLGEANQFSNPLYVIDGVPTTLEEVAGYGKTNNDFLTSLNIEDIETIDILKDASAAAIYGSRGANGVIIIKTKAGRPGKMTVALKGYVGVTMRPNLLTTPVGSAERAAKLGLIQDTWTYAGFKNSIPIMLTDSVNPSFNNNMDYQGLFYQAGIVQDYSAAITGGTEMLNYRLGIGYYNEEGIIKQTGLERYSMNLNISQEPWKAVRNQTIVNFSYVSREPGSANSNSRGNFPVSPVNMNSSLFSLTQAQQDFLTGKLDEYYRTDHTVNVQATNILNIDLWKGLMFNSQLSAIFTSEKRNQFEPSIIRTDEQGHVEYDYNQRLGTNVENYFSFSRDIVKDHNLNVLAGSSFEFNQTESMNIEAYGGSGDMIKTVTGYKQGDIEGSTSISQNSMLSYWVRLGYRFMNRYQVDFNYRRDASSRFGKNKRWGNFPSVGVFWIFSDESFLDFASDWLTFGKLKYSIGRNGKQFTDDYLRYNMYKLGYNSYDELSQGNMTTTSYNGTIAVIPDFSKLADDNLSWENSVQSDIGLDLELFNSRLYFSANYYIKNTDALLFSVQFPDYTGFNQVQANIAGIRNSGYELSVDAHLFPRRNDFTLQVMSGISRNTNMVTKLPNGNRDYYNNDYDYGYTVGKPGPRFYGFIYDGPLKSMDDLAVNPFTGSPVNLSKGGTWGTVEPGYPVFRDVSGDYNVSDEADQDEVLADYDPNPKVSGYLNFVVGYKQWQLRANTNFVFGRDVYDEVSQTILSRYDGSTWSQRTMVNFPDYDLWTPTNPDAYYPSLLPYASGSGVSQRYAFRANTSMWWEDGSFWKINDVTLSYNVNKDFLKKFRLERLYIFLTAYNVWQWQASDKLVDASMVDSRGHAFGDGYPQPRKYTIGVNVQF